MGREHVRRTGEEMRPLVPTKLRDPGFLRGEGEKMSLRLLPPEEKQRLSSYLTEGYGMDGTALEGYDLVEWEGGYWAVSPTLLELPLRKLSVDSVGLLIARGRGRPTPTVAALQLFSRPGPGFLSLSRENASSFIERKSIPVDTQDGRRIISFGDHTLDLGEVRGGRLIRVRAGGTGQ